MRRRDAEHGGGANPIVLSAVACLLACSGETANRGERAAERVRIEKARRGDLVDRVLVTGSLQAIQSVELRVPRTPVWELPIRWMAEDGASVKSGDRALEFDTSSFTRTLAEQRLQYLDAVMAFRTFEITAEAQERFGYAPLTTAVKAGILGGNAARLYGIDPVAVRCATSAADREALRADPPSPDALLGPRTARRVRQTFAADHPWFTPA